MKEHYYLASRVPAKGGLKIIRTDKTFPKKYEEQIEENCLEIFVPVYHHNAVIIYPIGDEKIMTALARKVEKSAWESRVHENIQGYIINTEEFSEQLLPPLSADEFDYGFYNWKVEEVDGLSEDVLGFSPVKENLENKNSFLDSLEPEERVGLFFAVYQTITKKEKIQLIVPEEKQRIVQAACYSILPYHCRSKLYTISGGECTQSDADILLTDEKPLQYQNSRLYKTMTLEEYIQRGKEMRQKNVPYFLHFFCELSGKREDVYRCVNRIFEGVGLCEETNRLLESVELYDFLVDIFMHVEGDISNEERLRKRVEQISSAEMRKILREHFPYLKEVKTHTKKGQSKVRKKVDRVELCIAHMKSDSPMQSVLREVRGYYYGRDRKREWNVFRNKLRSELEWTPLYPKEKEKFVTLLFLAYENYRGKGMHYDWNIIPAPYDLEGMLLFLKQKTKNNREYKKYAEEVLRQYNEVFTIYIPENKVERKVKCMGKGLKKMVGEARETIEKVNSQVFL